MNQKHAKISLAASALALPVALMAGNLTSLILKTNNPDNVDITANLAYLRPTLIVSFTIFGVLCVISLVFAIISMRKGDKSLSKFSLVVLVAVLLVSLAAGLLQKQTDAIERDYSKQRFDTLFQQLHKNLNEKKKAN